MHRHPKPVQNIALIKLEKKLEFNEYVKPICLNRNLHLQPHEIVAGVGWGTVFDYFNGTSEVSHYSDLLIEKILAIHKNVYIGTASRVIKTGGLNDGSLSGGIGGPLMARRKGRWYQVGIMSGTGSDKVTKIDMHQDGRFSV